MKEFYITEDVLVYFSYHYSPKEKPTISLCGMTTMQTQIPLKYYGTVSHLNERWCPNCDRIFKALTKHSNCGILY